MNKHIKTVLFWFGMALMFAGGLWAFFGIDAASQFLNVYTVESVLSVDNLAVIAMIFAFFGVELARQSKYLQWGIAGAWLFRAVFIGLGAAFLLAGHWVLYVMAGILIWQCVNMWGKDEDDEEGLGPKEQAVINFVEKRFKLSPFWQVVLIIELCDICFAVDSIPASFTVTQNPLIIWSANMFAIMGLRSLYFVVTDILDKFATVKQYGGPAVLGFIGLKILIGDVVEIPTWVSLLTTVAILGGSALIPVKNKQNETILEESK